jgi:hypothetical protein
MSVRNVSFYGDGGMVYLDGGLVYLDGGIDLPNLPRGKRKCRHLNRQRSLSKNRFLLYVIRVANDLFQMLFSGNIFRSELVVLGNDLVVLGDVVSSGRQNLWCFHGFLWQIVGGNGNGGSGRPEAESVGDVVHGLDNAIAVDVVVRTSNDAIGSLGLRAGRVRILISKIVLKRK